MNRVCTRAHGVITRYALKTKKRTCVRANIRSLEHTFVRTDVRVQEKRTSVRAADAIRTSVLVLDYMANCVRIVNILTRNV